MERRTVETRSQRLSTGISGLDEVLEGGLITRRAYLVRGEPGRGKTTLGVSFLASAGARESALFIGFQEPEEQVKVNARRIGLDVEHVSFLILTPDERFFAEQQGYDVFSAADVEQQPLAEAIVNAVEAHSPQRVFVDSMTQLRFLSADAFQFRKQVLSFLRFLTQRGITVLFSSEPSPDLRDDDLQFMADGVINIHATISGSAVEVSKMRGTGFSRGRHDMRLSARGMEVFPRMEPPARRLDVKRGYHLHSGAPRLDSILHGGIEAGTSTLITGPAGVGKSTLAAQFVAQAAREGHRAAVFLFEEDVEFYLQRARTLHLSLDEPLEKGQVRVEQVEPMRYLADEFTGMVRRDAEEQGAQFVVLDSVAGFGVALQAEGVEARLHAFTKTLSRMGVSVFLMNETRVVTGGEFQATERAISYMSDNVIFMRYMEDDGALRKALGVLKKRLSGIERTLHRYEIGRGGIRVQDEIEGVHGILSGNPMPQDNQS